MGKDPRDGVNFWSGEKLQHGRAKGGIFDFLRVNRVSADQADEGMK